MTKFSDRRKKWGEEMVFKSLSLPENIIEKLKLLRKVYIAAYARNVSYGEIFERLFSSMALGNVDPGIYSEFSSATRSRSEIDDIVTRPTKNAKDHPSKNTAAIRIGGKMTDDASKINSEREARCIQILKAAAPKRPTASWWATDEWYVNPETGKYYAVLVGKEGKSDYARTNGEVLGQTFCSEDVLLSEVCGFIRVKVSVDINNI